MERTERDLSERRGALPALEKRLGTEAAVPWVKRDTTLSDAPPATVPAAELTHEVFERSLGTRRRDTIGRLTLTVADMVAVAGSVLVVAALSDAEMTPWVIALLPVYGLLAKTAGLYDRDAFVLHKTSLDEAPAVVAVAAIFVLVIEALQAVEFTGRSHPLLLTGLLTVCLICARAAARYMVTRTTEPERVLVIGDAAATALLKRKLAGDPSLNATIVGRVSADPGPAQLGDHVLGTVAELPALIHEERIDRVVIAPAHEDGGDVVDLVQLATASGARVAVLPGVLEVIGTSVEFDDLGGRVLLGVRGFGLSPSSRFLKRAFDLIVATALIVFLAPFLLAVAVAVKLTSRGPVLFRQTRIGRDEHEFQMLKFRTMVNDADERKHELLERNEAAPLFKIADDPRTTWVGRHLRRRSLDELPQLFNVLAGDMSLVGPRPLIPEENRVFSGWQRGRYHVAPGMTGPWQILGSSSLPLRDMVTLEYVYCSTWSLWLDFKILVRTIPYVFSRRSPEHKAGTRVGP
jgi:exopolysaccharide biosynthesis polyprenyl glycosylphosphotransferase